MNALVRALVFGIGSGLAWSLAPGLCGGLFTRSPLPFLFAACFTTRILLSLLLAIPLRKSNKWMALLLGILALPVGSFCFGAIFATFSNANALERGLMFVGMSTLTPFMISLVPSAVLTTALLWRFLLRPNDCTKPANCAELGASATVPGR